MQLVELLICATADYRHRSDPAESRIVAQLACNPMSSKKCLMFHVTEVLWCFVMLHVLIWEPLQSVNEIELEVQKWD